jgi:pimeloyl-[acyl-carrier protein] methyl ester esterase
MIVLLLPGLDGTGMLLDDFASTLGEGHEPILLRYPPKLCTYSELLRWIKPQFPKDDYVILAESFSGPLAISIAAEQPQNSRRIYEA